MLPRGLTEFLADLWAFARTAVWNLSFAVYSVVMALWQASAWLFSWPSIAPTDYPERFALAAILVGSFVAYRKARIDSRWDREAFRLESFSWNQIPEEYGGPYVLSTYEFVAHPGANISYPQSIRLRMNQRPARVTAKVEDPDHSYALFATADSDNGQVRILGRTAVLEAFLPSLNETVPLRIDVESRSGEEGCEIKEISVRRYG